MKGTITVLLGLALCWPAAAQTPETALDKPTRIKVAVMDFDYGTVTNHWWGDFNIGKGLAEQVVDGLVNDGTVTVVERKMLDTVLAEQDFAQSDRVAPSAATLADLGKVFGVKYIIAGSVTKFGSGQKSYGAGAAKYVPGPFGMLGMLSFKKAKTEVGVTLRLIDTSTGEIVLSVKGNGLSKKGGGVTVSGFGKVAGGAEFSMASDDYKSSAIGEAQEKACQQVLQALLAKVSTLE
jgi:curli biogenesis system outer membrane secretion channel CsgG